MRVQCARSARIPPNATEAATFSTFGPDNGLMPLVQQISIHWAQAQAYFDVTGAANFSAFGPDTGLMSLDKQN